jgi:3-keto steroid reductase
MFPRGVGFGICERLILQLSLPHPPDANISFSSVLGSDHCPSGGLVPCQGLTLVMACRNRERAETARMELYQCLDASLARRRKSDDSLYGDIFRANLRIDIIKLDLGVMETVLEAGRELSERYGVQSFPNHTHFIVFSII